jgi:hypothetical protein
MAGNPEYQSPDPAAAPPKVTPADTPSSPLYGTVTPHGQGPAPYDIQAPTEDLSGALEAAGRLSGAGVVYPQGPRQAMTETLLSSAQGYGEQDIDAGYAGGGEWPSNIEPGG